MPIPSNCQIFRIDNLELIDKIRKLTGLPVDIIGGVVNGTNTEPNDLEAATYQNLGIQNKKDKLSYIDKDGFTSAADSTSIDELDRYVLQVWRYHHLWDGKKEPLSVIAKAIRQIAHPGEPLFEKRPGGTPNNIPPHEVKEIKIVSSCSAQAPCPQRLDEYAHDLDTYNILIDAPMQCKAYKGYGGAADTTRESEIDAPERGFIPDDKKDWVLKFVFFGDDAGDAPYPINRKLVENSIKVLERLAPGFRKSNPDEIFAAVQLIATWIDYSGWLGTAVANGFVKYVYSNNGKFQTRESTVRFASKSAPNSKNDAPMSICGIKQTYDIYLRRLVVFLTSPALISSYIKTRLVPDLESIGDLTNDKGKIRSHSTYAYWIGLRGESLRVPQNPELRALAESLSPKRLPPPGTIYPPDILKQLPVKLADFHRKHPGHENNWTLHKALLGLVYPYQKYRAQDYKVFKEAGDFAKENGIGLWNSDPTFRTLWEANLDIARYHPKDCLTGED